MTARDDLVVLLDSFGYTKDGEVSRLFLEYLRILTKWNSRLNLTSSSDWKVLGPLFHEAIWAACFYPQGPVRHLDIGSGGGFPAVPIRILRPAMRLDLLESSENKSLFLESLVQHLGLARTRVFNQRLESFLKAYEVGNDWDIASWKGLRLNREEVALLCGPRSKHREYWVFHGRDLPARDSVHFSSLLKPKASHRIPRRRGSYLTIFCAVDS